MLHGISSPMKSLLCFVIKNKQQLSIAIWYESELSCAEGTCGTCCEAMHRVRLISALLILCLVPILALDLPLL